MSAREIGVVHHAVVFFDANNLVKEMLQVEFEAVLDQVVGLPEFAGREICASFLQINQRLQIVGAVFFLVDFDTRGYVNRSWNVPLEHLLENAGRGPDLGSGRIRLACRSQCSVPWHSRQLWDPVFEGEHNSFEQMMQALQRNRLGLAADVPDITDAVGQPPLLDALSDGGAPGGAAQRRAQSQKSESLKNAPQKNTPQRRLSERATSERFDQSERTQQHEQINQKLQQEYRNKVTALKEEQQLQLATLKSAAQQQIDKLHQHYQMQMSQLKGTVESTQQLLVDEKRRAQKLKEKLAAQTSEFQRAREQLQAELTQQQEAEQNGRVEQLQQQFDVELKARVEQASAELKEMLDMREVELFYREEQLGTLREEIARLRSERERLIHQGGDQLLQHLVESGVAFVAYQPGVDAMMIPVSDIPRYLESPLAYVAEKCRVTAEQYQHWLSHYELPVCGALDKDGNLCGELLHKVDRPNEFLAGSSDRCAKHGEIHRHSETHPNGEAPLNGETKRAPRATKASSS